MTSAERKWTIAEEKRRQELIKRNGKELVSIGKLNFQFKTSPLEENLMSAEHAWV